MNIFISDEHMWNRTLDDLFKIILGPIDHKLHVILFSGESVNAGLVK